MSTLTSHPPAHEYALLPRASFELEDPPQTRRTPANSLPSFLARLSSRLPGVNKLSDPAVYTHYVTPRRRKRSVLRLVYWSLFSVPYILIFLVVFAAVVFPSYTVRLAHYQDLHKRALASTVPGRANPRGEKVFIAAALYEENGQLTSGAWGRSVLELVDLLGPENVHLSIYEDNVDAQTKQSLTRFRDKTKCNATIVFEDLDLSTLPRVTLPSGESRLKRIAFLAEVRNRALAPIDSNGVAFDKILFLNDVSFKPIEAAQLLFATNLDHATGRTDYAAACAVDFIMPFKFYDRFATRDFDNYITGLVFYPWFTSAGSATSRNDVLSGTDAVRVRSCWSGMVAYEAAPFQSQASRSHASSPSSVLQPTNSSTDVSPLRFRAESETFWESSECCLINADLQYLQSGMTTGYPPNPRIYMNPFIRVAYDETTLAWLSLVRRPEKLYAPIHDILNYFVGFPEQQERGHEEPGQTYVDTVWEYDNPILGLKWNATQEDLKGHWVKKERVAQPGGYCGGKNLLVINENEEQGEGRLGKILVPHPPDQV